MHGRESGRAVATFAVVGADGQAAPSGFVARLQQVGDVVRTRRGQLLVSAGAQSQDAYVVLTGRIRFSSYSADGKEVTMRDQLASSLFGELAAIDGGRRSVSVVAQEDSSLLQIPGAAFREAVLADAESMAWFAGHLVYQVRALTDRVFELSTLNVRARLHSQLLRLATASGVSDNRALLEPAPTHEVLANMIGTHREAVTRELSWLSGAGVVKSGRLRLEVLDVERLAAMVRRAMGDTRPGP